MTFGSTANNVWIPSSTVIDTMFGYYAPHWDAEVSIKNIVDVEYFTTAQSAGGYVGQPRTYYGPTRLALLSGNISSLPQADENRASRQQSRSMALDG